jgi:hypothetical protein
MDEETFRIVSSSLAPLTRSSADKELPSLMAAKTAGKYSEAEVERLLRALRSLSVIRSSSEVTNDEFNRDVTEALEEIIDSDEDRAYAERFGARLKVLLSAGPFVLEGKATSLLISDENVYCKARAITDLRPIFRDDLEEGPEAMIVVHSLKLTFHRGSREHQVFHLALDASDIAELRGVLDRAEAKAKVLKERVPQYPYWE